jgi:hypothetical protein
VGDPYNLRDVDCYDYSFEASEAGVSVGRYVNVEGTTPPPPAPPGVGYGALTGTTCDAI